MTVKPEHQAVECLLRGIAGLLPIEGFEGWAVVESSSRSENTKIVRVTKAGEPWLAFDRQGTNVLRFWTPVGMTYSGQAPIQRQRNSPGEPAGYHASVDSFFGGVSTLQCFEFKNLSEAWSFLREQR